MATNGGGRAPRAMIHKRILDAAESDSNASLEALAGEIAGASPDLVERVLEEYGDPGETPVDATTAEDPSMTDSVPNPTAAELTEKQRETLRAIAAAPDATQSELADALGVSRATVNKRLNDIEGFDWADREAFVELAVEEAGFTRSPKPAEASDVDGEPTAEADPTPTEDSTSPTAEAAVDGGQLLDPDAEQAIEQLQERVARLEQRLGTSADGSAEPALEDTELLAKLLRAMMADDDITEDEEVAVLDALR